MNFQGEEHEKTLRAALNYAASLARLERYAETKFLMRKTMPVARRVLGESRDLTLKIRWTYAQALYADSAATLDDHHEAVTTLEDVARISRRVLGNAHPDVLDIGKELQKCREDLARLGEDSDKAAMMALAFVAALAFLAGRRYLRR